jgi:hypothetical protein
MIPTPITQLFITAAPPKARAFPQPSFSVETPVDTRLSSSATPLPFIAHRSGASLWNNSKLLFSTYCLMGHPVLNSMALGHPASPHALAGVLPSIAVSSLLGGIGRNVADSMGAYHFEDKFSQRLLNILQKRELTGVFNNLTPHENLGNRSTFSYLCAVWNEQWKLGLFGEGLSKKKAISWVQKEPLMKRFINTLVNFPVTRWVLNVLMFMLPGNGKVGLKAESMLANALGKIPFVGTFLKEKTLVLARMKGLYFKTPHDSQALIYVKTGKQVQSVLADGTVKWENTYTALSQTHVSANEKASAVRYGIYQLLKASPDKGVGVWVQRWNHANAPLANTLWDSAQSGNMWRGMGAGLTHYSNWFAFLAGGKLLSYAGVQGLGQVVPANLSPQAVKLIHKTWENAGVPVIQASLPNLFQKPLFWANYRGASVGYNVLNTPSNQKMPASSP